MVPPVTPVTERIVPRQVPAAILVSSSRHLLWVLELNTAPLLEHKMGVNSSLLEVVFGAVHPLSSFPLGAEGPPGIQHQLMRSRETQFRAEPKETSGDMELRNH